VHDLLEASNAANVDEREREYRQSGWTPSTTAMAAERGQTTTGMAADTIAGSAATGARTTTGTDRGGAEERIPIIEEELRIGKREVSRGGVRVRSYIVEEPAHEQVALREERACIERRAVDQPLAGATEGDAFRERTVEVSETAEEAVVDKRARVREEVVVRKDVGERVEQIDDQRGTDRLAARDPHLDRGELNRDDLDRDRLGRDGRKPKDRTS
jgi:uncharacterized protein (TIGR02271 family)